MSVGFRIADHKILPGRKVVEILVGGKVVAVIYGDGTTVRFLSKHVEQVSRMPSLNGEEHWEFKLEEPR